MFFLTTIHLTYNETSTLQIQGIILNGDLHVLPMAIVSMWIYDTLPVRFFVTTHLCRHCLCKFVTRLKLKLGPLRFVACFDTNQLAAALSIRFLNFRIFQ